MLSSSLLVRVFKGVSTLADLRFHYHNSKPLLDVDLFQAGAAGRSSVAMDRPGDAAVFRKLLCFAEYHHSDLEDARRAYASPACPNYILMYYVAALMLNGRPSLPEFGKEHVAPLEGEDKEAEVATQGWSYRPNASVLASMAASR